MKICKRQYKFCKHTSNERFSIMFGGKRSGKTFTRLDYILAICWNIPNMKNQVIAESLPIIKTGCLSDFKLIVAKRRLQRCIRENSTDKMFFFPNGSTLQFMQVDNKDKANQLGRANFRFVNEANNISQETFDLLAINCENQIFLDFNPTAPFWVDTIQTETNIAKFNWYDNPFLTQAQKDQFVLWTELGKKAKVGSPNYYRWQVFCEGNYCELAGDIISVDNLRFESQHPQLYNFVAFADPSNARGGDYFAVCLCGLDIEGNVWMVDSFSTNNAPKSIIYDRLKEWRERYQCKIFIETNGEFGKKFYNDCLASRLSVASWWSSVNKFDRIFANLDIFTHKLIIFDTPANNEYCQQFYQFSPANKDGDGHDDNIDCLNNIFLYYIEQKKLKNLFV